MSDLVLHDGLGGGTTWVFFPMSVAPRRHFAVDKCIKTDTNRHRGDIAMKGKAVLLLVALGMTFTVQAQQTPAGKKPNIIVFWGDDIGQSNISAYSHGLMGYRTPNIDRIAKEGMMFTDYYAEQSCTAGRASFITGQSGLRTGLTKVGLPG